MKYFIFLDENQNVLYLLQTDNPTQLSGGIEVSKEDYDVINQNIGSYRFQYIDGQIINQGKIIISKPLEIEDRISSIEEAINFLLFDM